MVVDDKAALSDAKKAKAIWMKAGAKAFRARQFYTGVFQGQWLIQMDFDDLGHLQTCRDAVNKSKEGAALQASVAKSGSKLVAREVLLGIDVCAGRSR
jgi:hypothetical protein